MGDTFSAFSFCESVTGIGVWHVRRLTPTGPHHGGGIDSPSLCKIVHPAGAIIEGKNYRGGGGWDLETPVTNQLLNHCCIRCKNALLQEVKKP